MNLNETHLLRLKAILSTFDYSFFAFGSRVHGHPHLFSDIDLFFIESIPETILLQIEEALECSDIPYHIDITDFNRCDRKFQSIMLKNHLIIQSSSLLKKIEGAILTYLECLSYRFSLSVKKIQGVHLISSNSSSTLLNVAFGELSNPNENKIHHVIKAFNGKAFAWWIPPSRKNSNLDVSFKKLGFATPTHTAIMLCSLNHITSPTLQTTLTITPVINNSELKKFLEILRAHGDPKQAFPKHSQKLFVGCFQKKPVVIALLCDNGNHMSTFNILTESKLPDPEYHAEMIRYLINFSKHSGAHKLIAMSSNDREQQLYASLGFQTTAIFQYIEYHPS